MSADVDSQDRRGMTLDLTLRAPASGFVCAEQPTVVLRLRRNRCSRATGVASAHIPVAAAMERKGARA
jgi:hypothetical protein